MAIFGNFKGTTQSEFQIGKNSEGSKISTGTQPSSGISQGDVYVDSSNSTLQIYNNAWVSVGSTLTDLNVDSGTLFVDSSNDTVSVGSTSSNDKLFVNGSLRLGTNPTLKFSGAYLDVTHSNGTATQLRVRDNGSSSDPIFKVYNASNSAEVFKVQGSTTTINNAYALPTADGSANQVLKTDGSGILSFGSIPASGSNTQVQFNDGGDLAGDSDFTFDKSDNTLTVTNLDVLGTFSHVEDYGLISQATNVTIDMGNITTDDRQPTSHDSYTVSEAGSISGMSSGDMIFVSDETGGATMAFYDGSNWRRIQDRAVIS
jgi:hypothetical protein|tara:strand:+ start:198 stop:1145 length:948 start_codon:yes stop_codon:yes gene_type:complete